MFWKSFQSFHLRKLLIHGKVAHVECPPGGITAFHVSALTLPVSTCLSIAVSYVAWTASRPVVSGGLGVGHARYKPQVNLAVSALTREGICPRLKHRAIQYD